MVGAGDFILGDRAVEITIPLEWLNLLRQVKF
jgi:hypothetical protein